MCYLNWKINRLLHEKSSTNKLCVFVLMLTCFVLHYDYFHVNWFLTINSFYNFNNTLQFLSWIFFIRDVCIYKHFNNSLSHFTMMFLPELFNEVQVTSHLCCLYFYTQQFLIVVPFENVSWHLHFFLWMIYHLLLRIMKAFIITFYDNIILMF